MCDEPIEKIMNYWYLFSNKTLNTKFYMSDYLLEYFSSLYSAKSFNLSGVYLGASFSYVKEELIVITENSQISSDLTFGKTNKRCSNQFLFQS